MYDVEWLRAHCVTDRQRQIVDAVAAASEQGDRGKFARAAEALGAHPSQISRDFRHIESRARSRGGFAPPQVKDKAEPWQDQGNDPWLEPLPDDISQGAEYAGERVVQPMPMPDTPRRAQGSVRRIVSANDIHFPFHNQAAWRLFLHAVAFIDPDVFIANGDWLDFWALSRFSKDPRRRVNARGEVSVCKHELRRLDATLRPDCDKRWVDGNHDNRWDRYIMNTAADIHDFVPRLNQVLELEQHGWSYMPYMEGAHYVGDFSWQHDTGRCGINAARQSLADAGQSVAVGHSHRACTWIENDSQGQARFAVNGGWLGDWRQIDYRHRNLARREWPLGFTLVYQCRDTGQTLDARLVPIINESRVVIEGVELRL